MSGPARSPLDDIEFLARSDHRVIALAALARQPQSRADLRSMTDVSQSTIGRTLREFEERNWIRRDGREYEATQLGGFVASGMSALVDRVETEQSLRDVWQYLPTDDQEFSVEFCLGAEVTVAKADDPYRPINRFRTLIGTTAEFRFVGFDVALLDPCTDELCQLIVDGMHAELLVQPSVVQYIRSTYPEQFAETLDSGNLTVSLHDNLPPYGVSLFEERVAITGCDPDSGMVRVVVDTEQPAAREWAESIYESYRRETPTVSIESTLE